MTTIDFRQQSAHQIDNEKIKLEASVIAELRKIFSNLANDASNLYKAQGDIDSNQLAENYRPEFLKAIRDAYRKSIRKFGFSLRKTIETKHNLFFGAENKAKILNLVLLEDLNIKQVVEIEDDNADDKLQSINNQFLIDSTIFVANESEASNEFVTETNSKMIDSAIAASLAAFAVNQSQRQEEINTLQSRLVGVDDARERSKITRDIDKATRQMELANRNRQDIVAENIKTNVLNVREARSTVIAGQNIGLAEAWSRQKEAELIDDANLISASGATLTIEKEWVAILDSRTRSSHALADGQVVNVQDSYSVEGEALMYPRDPNGSAGNIINCRCISDNRVVTR